MEQNLKRRREKLEISLSLSFSLSLENNHYPSIDAQMTINHDVSISTPSLIHEARNEGKSQVNVPLSLSRISLIPSGGTQRNPCFQGTMRFSSIVRPFPDRPRLRSIRHDPRPGEITKFITGRSRQSGNVACRGRAGIEGPANEGRGVMGLRETINREFHDTLHRADPI